MNTMAVLALVFAFVFSPLGIVFGMIGRRQIMRSGERGRGLATAGLVLGAVFVVLGVALGVVTAVAGFKLATTVPTAAPTTTASGPGTTAGSGAPAATPPGPVPSAAAPGAPGPAAGASGTVAGADVAEQILAQTNGQAANPQCGTDLPKQVGASIICTATVNDQPARIRVTVTSVDGDTVNFDIDQQ